MLPRRDGLYEERLPSASLSQSFGREMFARLREMGLVNYEPYRGASLTEEGLSEALRLVHRHRLIETFLLEQLDYSWRRPRGGRAARARRFGQVRRTARGAARTPRRDPAALRSRRWTARWSLTGRFPLTAAAVGQRVLIAPCGPLERPLLTYLGSAACAQGGCSPIRRCTPWMTWSPSKTRREPSTPWAGAAPRRRAVRPGHFARQRRVEPTGGWRTDHPTVEPATTAGPALRDEENCCGPSFERWPSPFSCCTSACAELLREAVQRGSSQTGGEALGR